MRRLTHGSLFSGIGGAELAAEWNGIENVFHCEKNPFGKAVLDYWFPNSVSYDDITKTDFTEWRGSVDIITGGFPCQPFSIAGSRRGTADTRYLWPQMCRVIREVRPRYIIGENVAGIISMVESLNENGVEGEAAAKGEGDYRTAKRERYTADRICEDLEKEGYSVAPVVIPACAVGAPHRRERVWFLAKLNGDEPSEHHRRRTEEHEGVRKEEIDTHAAGTKCGLTPHEGVPVPTNVVGLGEQAGMPRRLEKPGWEDFPTQSPLLDRGNGVSIGMDKLAIPYTKFKNETIKAMGNAWVPQVAYEIFKAIKEDYANDLKAEKKEEKR